MDKNSKIYVAGATGMVGSSIVRELKKQGYNNLLTPSHVGGGVDLINQDEVKKFFDENKPEYVFLCAAKVGGIVANNNHLADFMYENMMIEMNVIKEAFNHEVKKLLFMGSGCIYPRNCPQPIKEEYLLTSELEKTNEAYALAKISGLKFCEFLNKQYGTNYISVMPANLYGINDNYHPENSHVLPGMLRRFHEAKINNLESCTCWGDGSALREFMFVDDLADFSLFLMDNYNEDEPINAGTGIELSMRELAELVKKVVGYKGEIKWDKTRPNGTPRKLLDLSKSKKYGWKYKTELEDGIKITYDDFLNHKTRENR